MRSFETLETKSGRSIPPERPPACEPQAPVPTSLGLTVFGVRSSEPQPPEGEAFQYRIKNVNEPHERIAKEYELRSA